MKRRIIPTSERELDTAVLGNAVVRITVTERDRSIRTLWALSDQWMIDREFPHNQIDRFVTRSDQKVEGAYSILEYSSPRRNHWYDGDKGVSMNPFSCQVREIWLRTGREYEELVGKLQEAGLWEEK